NAFDKDKLNSILEVQSDIGLCIISLLQDTLIKVTSDRGFAILHVLDYKGCYRLYCKVINSSVEKVAKITFGNQSGIIFGFPVIETNARNIDDLHFDEHDGEVYLNEDLSFLRYRKSSSLIEIYRIEGDSSLHTRIIKRAHE